LNRSACRCAAGASAVSRRQARLARRTGQRDCAPQCRCAGVHRQAHALGRPDFLHERLARGDTGRNGLVFGEPHAATDFYYRNELEQMRKDGHLDQLDLAFSRDQSEMAYVQDRMREQGAQLQEGAHLYACGDASRMTKDVDVAAQGRGVRPRRHERRGRTRPRQRARTRQTPRARCLLKGRGLGLAIRWRRRDRF
jgi:hypothetical protein